MIITTYLHKYIISDVMCRLPILYKKTTTLKHVKIRYQKVDTKIKVK